MIGILFFLIRIIIILLYEPEYLEMVFAAQMFIFIIYFINIQNFYTSLFAITRNEKNILKIRIILSSILVIFYFIGIFFFGFEGIIISRVIGFSIGSLLFWVFGNYVIKSFRLSLKQLYLQFLFLIVIILMSSLIGLFLNPIIFSENTIGGIISILNNLGFQNLEIEQQLYQLLSSSFNIIVFIILYIIHVIIFRRLTIQDVLRIEKLNLRIPFKNKLIKIAKKLLLNEKRIDTS